MRYIVSTETERHSPDFTSLEDAVAWAETHAPGEWTIGEFPDEPDSGPPLRIIASADIGRPRETDRDSTPPHA